MRTLKTKSLRKFSDSELLSRLVRLEAKERQTILTILIYLIEIERRSLHLKQGYRSLFDFCVSRLRYSESAAARRIRAARCIRDFPEIYTMLSSGELNLCSVSKVSAVLTRKNKKALLSEIAGRSSREIDIIISQHQPKRNIRDRVRPVYVMTETEDSGRKFTADVGSKKVDTSTGSRSKKRSYKGEFRGQSAWIDIVRDNTGAIDGGGPGESVPRVKLEQKFKLEFAVDPEFMATLKRLKALLSNKYPKGLDFERLFEIIIDDYLERHSPEGRLKRKKRSAKAKKLSKKAQAQRAGPRAHAGATIKGCNSTRASTASSKSSARSKDSRYISQSVRDEVFTRDGGRCTYRAPDGRRCTENRYLQIDHIVPFAMGGSHSVDNLRLLCARHNNLEAERAYGKKFMERFNMRE